MSIITPTRDQRAFVENCIRSVADQTYGRIEHLVVDGASTDGTVELLRSRTVRWLSEPDVGMYDAIDKGLDIAGGEILGYLNADDAYMPWTVERVVAAFEAHPDVEVVFGDGVRVDQATGHQELRLFPPFDGASVAYVGSLMQPTVFWRRMLMDRIGLFDRGLRFVGDLDYWLRAGATTTIAHIDEVLAVELVHDHTLSVAHAAAMAEEDREMRRRHGAAPATRAGQAALARALRREKIWARRNWLRFLAATMVGGRNGPWSRFLSSGRVKIDRTSALLGLLPGRGDRYLPNAVVSEVAAELVALTA